MQTTEHIAVAPSNASDGAVPMALNLSFPAAHVFRCAVDGALSVREIALQLLVFEAWDDVDTHPDVDSLGEHYLRYHPPLFTVWEVCRACVAQCACGALCWTRVFGS